MGTLCTLSILNSGLVAPEYSLFSPALCPLSVLFTDRGDTTDAWPLLTTPKVLYHLTTLKHDLTESPQGAPRRGPPPTLKGQVIQRWGVTCPSSLAPPSTSVQDSMVSSDCQPQASFFFCAPTYSCQDSLSPHLTLPQLWHHGK
ncbi:hypothetical protein HJG60_010903 [Phyllostomus discolor]|uniref:Uncharacterized protein n=1 Tax=Phyllostomus discolor TaxID=89673 RepID=A0A834ECT6_9CHIR|nr:hypothetical protein HJG60_010903 [Phyllostomus discolor]